MFLFRSLVTGLAGACFVLLALYEPPVIESTQREPPARCARVLAETVAALQERATIVDVASSVPATSIAALVRLEPDEHVATVDDAIVENDLAAGAAIAAHASARTFVDVGVAGPTSARRVLLLIH